MPNNNNLLFKQNYCTNKGEYSITHTTLSYP